MTVRGEVKTPGCQEIPDKRGDERGANQGVIHGAATVVSPAERAEAAE